MEFVKRTQRTIHIREDSIEIVQKIADMNDTSFNKVVEQLILSYGQPYVEEAHDGTDTPDRL